jgi:hypothetical protein
MYEHRNIVLSTKHEKEKIIAPLFKKYLKADVITPDNIDTDLLGTFTGEIKRVGTMKETALRKALMGMEMMNISLGIASEGSFGPHPQIPFIPANNEMMVFVDTENKLEIVEQLLTTHTNFGYFETNDLKKAESFLIQVGFPKQGVIVKPKNSESNVIYKGIKNKHPLSEAILGCARLSPDGIAHIETDMRAHMNPLRQKAIRSLTFKLIKRIRSQCPMCASPGWGIVHHETGLPCEICYFPTKMIRTDIFGCVKCSHQITLLHNKKIKKAEARFCDECNP